MKENYYIISKENALRAGLDEVLRTKTEDGNLLLSEKDIRNITLTADEIAVALGGVLYVEESEIAIEPEKITE